MGSEVHALAAFQPIHYFIVVLGAIFSAGVAWGISRAQALEAKHAAEEAERKAKVAHERLDRLVERLRQEDLAGARISGAIEERVKSLERDQQIAREDSRRLRDELSGHLARVELEVDTTRDLIRGAR